MYRSLKNLENGSEKIEFGKVYKADDLKKFGDIKELIARGWLEEVKTDKKGLVSSGNKTGKDIVPETPKEAKKQPR